MNRVDDPDLVARWFPEGSSRRLEFERKGSLLVGDVEPAVAGVAGALTPVPGGVGPLTRRHVDEEHGYRGGAAVRAVKLRAA